MNAPMTRSTKLSRTRGVDHVEQPPVPKAQRTRGRPSEYDVAVLPEVAEMISQGATSREVIEHLGISSGTFWRWCQAYPELRSAVKMAKDAQDERVVDALRINAVLEGNVTAQIFWLKNRQPDLWRDRKETEIIVPIDENADAPDVRQLALQGLALFNAAVYDPDEQPAAGPLTIEGHAREEIDDGAVQRRGREPADGRGEPGYEEAYDPDFDEPDGAGDGFDLDPGEL